MSFHDQTAGLVEERPVRPARRAAAVRRASAPLLLLVLVACGHLSSPTRGAAGSGPGGVTIPLHDYRFGLKTMELEVSGKPRTFLFDTGAGAILLSPGLAKEAGCEGYSRITGHRMSGERVDFARCAAIPVRLPNGGGANATGIYDVNALLPPDWPKLDGVIGLRAFDGMTITVALAKNRLTIESSNDVVRARAAGRAPVPIAIRRELEGEALDVFIPLKSAHGPIGVLLDSGSVPGNFIVDRRAAEALGIPSDGAPDGTSLRIENGPTLTIPAAVDDLVIEGNLGQAFMARFEITLDLKESVAWFLPVEP